MTKYRCFFRPNGTLPVARQLGTNGSLVVSIAHFAPRTVLLVLLLVSFDVALPSEREKLSWIAWTIEIFRSTRWVLPRVLSESSHKLLCATILDIISTCCAYALSLLRVPSLTPDAARDCVCSVAGPQLFGGAWVYLRIFCIILLGLYKPSRHILTTQTWTISRSIQLFLTVCCQFSFVSGQVITWFQKIMMQTWIFFTGNFCKFLFHCFSKYHSTIFWLLYSRSTRGALLA